MALVDGKAVTSLEEIDRKEGDQIIKAAAKVTRRVYPCREGVLARKQWKKFGEVENIARGKHKEGDFAVDNPVKIQTHEGEAMEELEFVKKFENMKIAPKKN